MRLRLMVREHRLKNGMKVLIVERRDYYQRFRENIRKVTATDVLRVAKAHLRPDKFRKVPDDFGKVEISRWPTLSTGARSGSNGLLIC